MSSDDLDFGNGMVVNIRRFEYVLKLAERTGLRNVSLIRYLKSDGFNDSEAIKYAVALSQYQAM